MTVSDRDTFFRSGPVEAEGAASVPSRRHDAGSRNHGCRAVVRPLTQRARLNPYRCTEGAVVSREEPIFNVPGSVLAVLALLVAVHVLLAALPEDSGTLAADGARVHPGALFRLRLCAAGRRATAVTSFLTYAVVHASLLHLGLNSAWLVAFGGAVAKRVNAVRFLAFSAFCAIAGGYNISRLQPRPDGADGRGVRCHLGADGRHHAVPVLGVGRGGLADLARKPAGHSADAARHALSPTAVYSPSPALSSWPTCSPFWDLEASTPAAGSRGKRTWVDISPGFWPSASSIGRRRRVHQMQSLTN